MYRYMYQLNSPLYLFRNSYSKNERDYTLLQRFKVIQLYIHNACRVKKSVFLFAVIISN